jgi:hypothetical protein
MLRRFAVFALIALAIAGCADLKAALTSHVDVAARAGSHELSSTQLAEMMNAAQMPPQKELAMAVASLWVNYQLLAQAAGRGDTLGDNATADDAMWAQIAQRKLQKVLAEQMKGAAAPSAADLEKAYAAGELLVVRHILLMADKNTLKPNQIDSVRRIADNIRKQATPANFVSLVTRHSADPGSKDAGGEYVWPTPQIPQMVPEFEQMSRTMKPGTISDPVQTQFGFHIIYRETYAEAKAKFDSAYSGTSRQKAESTWVASVEKDANVKVKAEAPVLVKKIAENVDLYRDNRTVLATSSKVDLRASRVAHWIAAFPPQMRIRQQLGQLPDSTIGDFLKSLIRNELLLRAADDSKLGLDAAEMEQIRGAFRGSVMNTMGGLGILPMQLADSVKGGRDRSTVATAMVNGYFDKLLKNQAQFIDVSEPLTIALRQKFEGSVAESGIDRAVTLATELKTKADSAAAASMPQSAVPMPGVAAPPAAAPTEPPPAAKKQP